MIAQHFVLQMASRVKDIRKIGSVNKGLSLSRPKSSAGIIAPEFLLGTRGPVTVDENGVVSRKISSSILTASFDGFSLSDLGQRIEEQRRDLARERQQTFGGILSDVQGLSNNLLMERNKAEADRLRCAQLELRNVELEAMLLLMQQQQQQQQQQQEEEETCTPSQSQTKPTLPPTQPSNDLTGGFKTDASSHQTSQPHTSPQLHRSSHESAAPTSSIACQCVCACTSSAAQTDELEPVAACCDNFVWCQTCETSARALEAADARLQQTQAELAASRAAVEEHERFDKERADSKHALQLQVEQLQQLLLLESGRAAQIQNASDSIISNVTSEINGQRQQLLQQLSTTEERCRRAEEQLHAITQEQLQAREALQEALREADAASAIEQHIKSKLSAAQQAIVQHKTELEQQRTTAAAAAATAAAARADLERLLLQKGDALQEAQTQVAELRQRYQTHHTEFPYVYYVTSSLFVHRCIAFETQHTKESKTQTLASSTHEREVVVIDKSKTSSAGHSSLQYMFCCAVPRSKIARDKFCQHRHPVFVFAILVVFLDSLTTQLLCLAAAALP